MIQISKKITGVLMVALLVLGLASIAHAETVTLTGTIVQSDGVYMLDTGAKKVILDGGVDQGMLNRKVKVIGTLGTDSNGKEIMTDIEDIQDPTNVENPQWS